MERIAFISALAAGLILAGLAIAHEPRIRIERHGPGFFGLERMENLDADEDGWISRAEMAAAAEKSFAERDEDKDGKLDQPNWEELEKRMEGARKRVKEAAEKFEDRRGDIERVHREVFVFRSEEGDEEVQEFEFQAPRMPALPPLMIFSQTSEADLNGDGALSKDEFVAQQLRFFDAADANRDGKVRAIAFPRPPAPPQPPKPPQP